MRFFRVLNFNNERKRAILPSSFDHSHLFLSIDRMLIEFVKIIDIRIFSPTNPVNFFKLDSISIRDATRDVSYSVKIRDKKKKRKKIERNIYQLEIIHPCFLICSYSKNDAPHRFVKYGRFGSFLNEITLRAPLKRCKY